MPDLTYLHTYIPTFYVYLFPCMVRLFLRVFFMTFLLPAHAVTSCRGCHSVPTAVRVWPRLAGRGSELAGDALPQWAMQVACWSHYIERGSETLGTLRRAKRVRRHALCHSSHMYVCPKVMTSLIWVVQVGAGRSAGLVTYSMYYCQPAQPSKAISLSYSSLLVCYYFIYIPFRV